MAAPLLATSALRVRLNHLSMGRIGHLMDSFKLRESRYVALCE